MTCPAPTLALKITYTTPSGSSTTRKLTAPRRPAPAFASLADTVKARFQLTDELAFTYRDEEGDLVTLSSDDELAELFDSLDDSTATLRFQVVGLPQNTATFASPSSSTTSGTATSIWTSSPNEMPPSAVDESSVPAHVKVVNDVVGLSDERLVEGPEKLSPKDEDEWMRISHRDIQEKQRNVEEEFGADVEEPTTPTLLFEDPDDDPLPSTAELAQARIEREFPPPASSSAPFTTAPIDSAAPGGFPDDPSEAPLPPSPPSVPFGALPTSFASLLSSLPLHAESISTRLSSALSSPDLPTHRISSFLSRPPSSLDDLPALARALPSLGAELGGVVREVLEGVKREAEEIRGEFARFRGEVEREKSWFEDELRKAMETAKAGEAATQTRQTPIPSRGEPSIPAFMDEEQEEKAERLDEEGKEPAATVDCAAVEVLRLAKAEKRPAKEARHIERENNRQEKEQKQDQDQDQDQDQEQDQADVAVPNTPSKEQPLAVSVEEVSMPGGLPPSSSTRAPFPPPVALGPTTSRSTSRRS
ncbi:hypothetical protein JCM21900_004522 [Sporobolomyces salmonicolor]